VRGGDGGKIGPSSTLTRPFYVPDIHQARRGDWQAQKVNSGIGIGIAWGDVPTWLVAAGTVLAFGATFWLLLLTRREQTNIRNEQHQAQARRINAWTTDLDFNTPDQTTVVAVHVRNGSDDPIRFASVNVAFTGETLVGSSGKTERPYRVKRLPGLPSILPPGYSETHQVSFGRTTSEASIYSIGIYLKFQDTTTGRNWTRNHDGTLREVDLDAFLSEDRLLNE
jgi:hypothetical protein